MIADDLDDKPTPLTQAEVAELKEELSLVQSEMRGCGDSGVLRELSDDEARILHELATRPHGA